MHRFFDGFYIYKYLLINRWMMMIINYTDDIINDIYLLKKKRMKIIYIKIRYIKVLYIKNLINLINLNKKRDIMFILNFFVKIFNFMF